MHANVTISTWALFSVNLKDGEGHRDAGDGDEISLDPLLAGAQAASVVDHRRVVPGLGKRFRGKEECLLNLICF